MLLKELALVQQNVDYVKQSVDALVKVGKKFSKDELSRFKNIIKDDEKLELQCFDKCYHEFSPKENKKLDKINHVKKLKIMARYHINQDKVEQLR